MARAWPHRSMFGQVALLTVILLGLGSYVLAIRPILNLRPPGAAGPLEVSAQQLRDAINTEMRALDGHPDRAVSREFQSMVAAATKANPGFRYYLRIGARSLGNLPQPAYFHAAGLDRIEASRSSANAPELCMQMFRDLSRRGAKGSMAYLNCRTPRYYEFYGLEHPIAGYPDPTNEKLRRFFWSYGSTFFYTVAGLFVLVSTVLFANMWTIRRVARVAQSFDGKQLDLQLPERGIPLEVLPLVRAINQLMARLGATQARQKFFLSAAAHELRTPLTVLRTRLELLDEAPIKDKLIGDVRRITTLVNQLLTLMKIDTLAEVEGAVDLVASTRKVIANLTQLAALRNIALSFATQLDSYVIAGGADLIEVAIANLIDNAISFTADGGEVFVALDEEGMLSVRDFGPGIDPAKAASLFEPFVRHPSNRRGHGLGLAIVEAIVTLHDGTAAARNADGPGAVFELRLPRNSTPVADLDTKALPVRVPSFRANG